MVGTGDTDMALTLMEGKSSHQETHESKSVKLGGNRRHGGGGSGLVAKLCPTLETK